MNEKLSLQELLMTFQFSFIMTGFYKSESFLRKAAATQQE